MEESNLMERNVVDFEPHLALFVPDHDPLIFTAPLPGLPLFIYNFTVVVLRNQRSDGRANHKIAERVLVSMKSLPGKISSGKCDW